MIPVQNIYYMLSYAFRALQAQSYRQVAAESFDHAARFSARACPFSSSEVCAKSMFHKRSRFLRCADGWMSQLP